MTTTAKPTPAPIFFDYRDYFLVVRKEATAAAGIDKRAAVRRICECVRARTPQQRIPGGWKSPGFLAQPAVTVDDGCVKWTITFTKRIGDDGRLIAFLVGADRHRPDTPDMPR